MSSLHVLILAAGKGKRMVSELPKVLHPVLFKPMLHHVISTVKSLSSTSISIVVGHGEEQVTESCRAFKDVQFFQQKEQKGTAHAVLQAEPFLKKQSGTVLVLCGDVILLRAKTLSDFLEFHLKEKNAATLLTAVLSQPTGYGRILREDNHRVLAIREERDSSEFERRVTEVNSGIYCFEISELLEVLPLIQTSNQQKEFYLTDAVDILVKKGKSVGAQILSDSKEMTGINDRMALSEVEKILQQRINRSWMEKGVTLRDPQTIWIDSESTIGSDVMIGSGSEIVRSTLASSVIIESQCHIYDSEINKSSVIKQGSYLEESKVGEGSHVGPYAHLRPGTELQKDVKIGNFVEVKKSTIGEGSKASHLSYIGDAEIGKNVNLGCGFITCNFDGGPVKHKTIIEDEVFVGSDSQTVAPVRLGKGSYVASGTTVTEDVPPDALAMSRGPQNNREGVAARLRARKMRNPGNK
jgi:bifunctional UDP-N-acetylglucosamine pyrophosphorylase/glucosamine-1-phosphate N-acetyltransferase